MDQGDGWQRDYGKLTGTVSLLARERRAYRTAAEDLAKEFETEADECCSVTMAESLRKCAERLRQIVPGTVPAPVGPASG